MHNTVIVGCRIEKSKYVKLKKLERPISDILREIIDDYLFRHDCSLESDVNMSKMCVNSFEFNDRYKRLRQEVDEFLKRYFGDNLENE